MALLWYTTETYGEVYVEIKGTIVSELINASKMPVISKLTFPRHHAVPAAANSTPEMPKFKRPQSAVNPSLARMSFAFTANI